MDWKRLANNSIYYVKKKKKKDKKQKRYPSRQGKISQKDKERLSNYKESIQFFNSDTWFRERYNYILKQGNACQSCEKTEFSSIDVYSKDEESRTSIYSLFVSSLTILCEECCIDKKIRKRPYILTKTKGNIRKYNKIRDSGDFVNTLAWINLRNDFFRKIDSPYCLCCGETQGLQADHVKPKSKYSELALDINNLQPLCKICNFGKSNYDSTDWRITSFKKSNNSFNPVLIASKKTIFHQKIRKKRKPRKARNRSINRTTHLVSAVLKPNNYNYTIEQTSSGFLISTKNSDQLFFEFSLVEPKPNKIAIVNAIVYLFSIMEKRTHDCRYTKSTLVVPSSFKDFVTKYNNLNEIKKRNWKIKGYSPEEIQAMKEVYLIKLRYIHVKFFIKESIELTNLIKNTSQSLTHSCKNCRCPGVFTAKVKNGNDSCAMQYCFSCKKEYTVKKRKVPNFHQLPSITLAEFREAAKNLSSQSESV